MFKVNEVKFKNDTVLVSFDDMDILLLLDFYVEEGIKKDNEYDALFISRLLKEEVYTNAYLKVLNKLKYKDRTVKEIKDFVSDEFEIDDEYLNKLIDDLNNKGYLDDRRYALSYVDSCIYNLKGLKLIKKELIDKGIEKELVDSIINEVSVDENDLAYKYANKIAKTISNKSLINAKQFIKQKLLLRGFDYLTSDLALSRTDFSLLINNQEDNLQKALKKAENRYGKKYSGYELKNKIITYLLAQGYKYDDINIALSKQEDIYE